MEPRTERKRPLAFRVASETADRLKRHARESGASLTALAERHIEEGLRMADHPLIHFRDGALGRRPGLIGTRLDVADVVQVFRLNDRSVAKTARYLEQPVSHIDACLRYYAEFQQEVEEWIARAEAISEREESLWLRQQKLAG